MPPRERSLSPPYDNIIMSRDTRSALYIFFVPGRERARSVYSTELCEQSGPASFFISKDKLREITGEIIRADVIKFFASYTHKFAILSSISSSL